MHPIYCANPAIQTAIADALDFHDLWPDPAAVTHRPRCADRLNHQLARVERSSAVLESVRARVQVDEPTRRLIERLVDSASILIECEEAVSHTAGAARRAAAVHPSPPPPPVIQSSRAKRKAVRA